MKKRGILAKFNDYLADKMSYILSIMVTFYIVCLLVTIPLFYSRPASVVAWASYLCSVVFQGVALPVLGYTARKAGDKSDKVMETVLKLTKEIDKIVKHIESQQDKLEEEIKTIKK